MNHRQRTPDTALFVYGTLRAGEALDGMLPDAPRYTATVRGRLHYSPHTEGYPVLLPGGEDDRVTGEVVWVNLDNADANYVMTMELQAGYSATWCDVHIGGAFGGGDIRALTFTWHPSDGMGERIDGDDWMTRNVGRQWHVCKECLCTYASSDNRDECEWKHDNDDLDAAMTTSMIGDQ